MSEYPMYNKKGELIGKANLDHVYDGEYGAHDPVILCEDMQGRAYEVGAWSIERVINFSDPTKPRTYARTLS